MIRCGAHSYVAHRLAMIADDVYSDAAEDSSCGYPVPQRASEHEILARAAIEGGSAAYWETKGSAHIASALRDSVAAAASQARAASGDYGAALRRLSAAALYTGPLIDVRPDADAMASRLLDAGISHASRDVAIAYRIRHAEVCAQEQRAGLARALADLADQWDWLRALPAAAGLVAADTDDLRRQIEAAQ